MQVQRIQNNINNTNFCAKFKIMGHFNDIPSNVLTQWKYKAKKIGTEKDLVLINLDSERMFAFSDYHNLGSTTFLYGRNASITKVIDGDISNDIGVLYGKKPFGTDSEECGMRPLSLLGNSESRLSRTISVISEYLDNLIKK